MAAHWQTIREAADDLGVAPETLTRRMRSGRSEAGPVLSGAGEDAPVPPPTGMPYPRPQTGATAGEPLPPPLPKPPLCTLPPARPLPPTGSLPTPSSPQRRASDASAVAAAAAQTYVPPR